LTSVTGPTGTEGGTWRTGRCIAGTVIGIRDTTPRRHCFEICDGKASGLRWVELNILNKLKTKKREGALKVGGLVIFEMLTGVQVIVNKVEDRK
jgi:hypothetical protein